MTYWIRTCSTPPDVNVQHMFTLFKCTSCCYSGKPIVKIVWSRLRVFLLNRCQVWKGLMKSSLWLSTSITTEQFNSLMASLWAQTELNHSLCCSSHSFLKYMGRNVCLCLQFAYLPMCLESSRSQNYQCRSNEQSIRLFLERHSQKCRRTAAREMTRRWSQSSRLCGPAGSRCEAGEVVSMQTGTHPQTPSLPFIHRIWQTRRVCFPSKVHLYEINGKYEFHYQTRLRC